MRDGVATLGDVGNGEQRPRHRQTSSSPARTISLPSISTRRFEHHAVEVHRHLDFAADRRRGAEGDVGGAEDLLVLEDVAGQGRLFVGADAELGDVGAVLAVRGQQLHQRGALGPGRVGEVAVAHGQLDRRLDLADAGDRAVDDERALAAAGGDEGLAAGQVAEGAGGVEHAGVGDRHPVLEAEPQVAAVPAGDPRLLAGPQRRGQSRPAPAQLAHVGVHQPRQHVGGDAGQGGDPGAGLVGGAARVGVGERLDRRRQHHVGGDHRRRNRRRRLGPVGVELGDHRQRRVGTVALGLDPHQRADVLGHRVADHQHLLGRFHPQAIAENRTHRPVEFLRHRTRLSPIAPTRQQA